MHVAFFLNGTAGRLFCTGKLHDDGEAVPGRVLIVPPLAEEMNKSRHVLAAIARAAGDAGYDALLPDLYGTGDSEGDFGDATLEVWRSDLDEVIGRMRETAPLHIVALRAGALLAGDALARHAVHSLVMLQPQHDGRQLLTQLLRLRLAAGLFEDGGKETAAQLRRRFEQGEALEIAGYRFSADLAAGLESMSLENTVVDAVENIAWLEFASQPDRPLLPASRRVLERWEAAGRTVKTSVVACDPFWATQEIARCPAAVPLVLANLAG